MFSQFWPSRLNLIHFSSQGYTPLHAAFLQTWWSWLVLILNQRLWSLKQSILKVCLRCMFLWKFWKTLKTWVFLTLKKLILLIKSFICENDGPFRFNFLLKHIWQNSHQERSFSAAWLSASCSAWTCTTLLSQILHYKFKITADIYQSDLIQDSLSCGLFLDICHYTGCVECLF